MGIIIDRRFWRFIAVAVELPSRHGTGLCCRVGY